MTFVTFIVRRIGHGKPVFMAILRQQLAHKFDSRSSSNHVEKSRLVTALDNTCSSVQLLAEYLGEHQFDIEKACLNDLEFDQSSRIAIASFEMSSNSNSQFDMHQQAIESLLIANMDRS